MDFYEHLHPSGKCITVRNRYFSPATDSTTLSWSWEEETAADAETDQLFHTPGASEEERNADVDAFLDSRVYTPATRYEVHFDGQGHHDDSHEACGVFETREEAEDFAKREALSYQNHPDFCRGAFTIDEMIGDTGGQIASFQVADVKIVYRPQTENGLVSTGWSEIDGILWSPVEEASPNAILTFETMKAAEEWIEDNHLTNIDVFRVPA